MDVDREHERGETMKKENAKKWIEKKAATMLNVTLQMDANSPSCMGIYQPKAPEERKV